MKKLANNTIHFKHKIIPFYLDLDVMRHDRYYDVCKNFSAFCWKIALYAIVLHFMKAYVQSRKIFLTMAFL